jgi:hypothetical protein
MVQTNRIPLYSNELFRKMRGIWQPWEDVNVAEMPDKSYITPFDLWD